MKFFRVFSFVLGTATVLPAIIGGALYSVEIFVRLFKAPVLSLIGILLATFMTLPGAFHILVSLNGLRHKVHRSLVKELLMLAGGIMVAMAAGFFLLWDAVTQFHQWTLFNWWMIASSISFVLIGVTMVVAVFTERKVTP